ncbi:hypothetical protein K8T06_00110, partial [bacterium]|nr:hypothetical protein [bacterium]
ITETIIEDRQNPLEIIPLIRKHQAAATHRVLQAVQEELQAADLLVVQRTIFLMHYSEESTRTPLG